jgi:GMP synthase (glutamine-hydrolysing)
MVRARGDLPGRHRINFSAWPVSHDKIHHNVGGLPDRLKLKIVEPLGCSLKKDEVRKVGKALSIPDEILNRHPFLAGLGMNNKE